MKPEIEAALAKCTTLPTLPAVAQRVLELCQADEPEPELIAEAIRSDAALSAKLLRLVNSPAYGLRQEVRSVRHAATMLGLISIRTIALSFSLAQGMKSHQQSAFKSYWRRSVLSAVAARELATVTKACDREEAFLVGLLQDLGMIALSKISTRRFVNLGGAIDDHTAVVAFERGEFGCDHAEAGAWLAARWKLPASYVSGIRFSHEPDLLPPGTAPDLARLVAVAAISGLIADIWIHPDPAAATQRAQAMAARLLGLDDAGFVRVVDGAKSQASDIARLLETDVGSQAELDSIAERARETLLMLSMNASREMAVAKQTMTSLEARARALEEENHRDALTGLANRAALDQVLADEWSRAQSSGALFSIVMVDLDHFKRINDTHGHPVGDRVLRGVGAVLKRLTRPRDLAGRYGGEEFMLVLPDTNREGSMMVAERLRAAIAGAPVAIEAEGTLSVTASFGCSTLDPRRHASAQELVSAADRALYEAKRSGRDRVVAQDPADTSPAAPPARSGR